MSEEQKLTLPSGHPEAGYVTNDPSFTDGAGTLDPESQQAYDEMVAAYEEDKEAVAAHEHEVATAEREAELATPTQTETKAAPKTTTAKSDS